jgi:hypothetical protein
MINRSLTVLSGVLLLLAANAVVTAQTEDAEPAAPGAAADKPAMAQDAKSQREEREAIEPAVSEPVPSTAAPPPAEATPPAAPAPKAPGAASTNTKFRTVDRIELESTAITGNRELPKVLYIVPWKKADLGDLVGRPANSLLDEVLTPVDREVFRRQTEYFSKLDTQSAGGAVQPAQKAVPAPPR